jgi:hypothetical protein
VTDHPSGSEAAVVPHDHPTVDDPIDVAVEDLDVTDDEKPLDAAAAEPAAQLPLFRRSAAPLLSAVLPRCSGCGCQIDRLHRGPPVRSPTLRTPLRPP